MFTRKSIFRLLFVLLAALLMSGAASASPLADAISTSFTFQGRLTDSGAPANGSYDLEFKLYDALNGGNQVGNTISQPGVTVTNGLFTVQLDFGNIFDGTALYLQIGVRPGGSIDPHTLLTPRQPLSATPYAIHAMQSSNADLLDGLNASAFAHAPQNVVVVAKSGGNFSSIQAAINSISDASASNPYLIYIAPGVYTESVTMKSYVDIQGSGELTTKITSTDGGSTVLGANNAELRFLTVENTGGNSGAIAIYNYHTSPRLTHVTASASGGAYNYGVYNDGYSPTMTNVTASASGGANSYGVANYGSSPTMMNVIASASGGEYNYGVYNNGHLPTMTNVTASASGGTYSYAVYNNNFSSTMTNVIASASGGTYNYGVANYNSSLPTMTNVTASASGGTISLGVYNYASSPRINNGSISASGGTSNFGIYNETYIGASPTVRVSNSQVSGSTNSIENSTNVTILVGASQLSGGAADAGGGTLTCAGVYDENYVFYASTCP